MADSPTSTLSVQDLERVLNIFRIASNINCRTLENLLAKRAYSQVPVACVVIMYYDWITILNTEIEFIWKAKWSRLTVAYLSARYLTLVYCPMVLYYQFNSRLSESGCTKLYNIILLTTAVAVVCAAPILTIRTMAVWEHRRWITCVAVGLLMVSTLFLLLFSVLSLKHTDHTKPPEIAGLVGCIQTFQSFHLSVVFVTGTVFDTVNLGLLLVRGTSLLWWGNGSRLFRTVYGDGILFHVYMSCISITNLVFIFGSSDYQALLVMVPGALRSLLATRVVLHIRMQQDEAPMIGMSEDTMTIQQTKMSALEFRGV